MGSAIFPIVLAKHYNGNTETAFDTVISNTLVSIITLPLWIAFGMKMI
jgi:predicted permease